MPQFTELWPGGPRFAQAGNQRLSTDCVLLSDFVRTRPRRRGADLGCASGAIALLLLAREPSLLLTGLELDRDAAALARENMAENRFTEQCEILTGDIREHRALFRAGSFDFAVANPPYFPLGRGALAPDPARAAARSETDLSLEELCRAAAWLLRSGGSFFLVHRPERLSELLCTLSACALEPKRLRLVCPRPESAPSLILLEARRGGQPGLQIEPPLLLYDSEGRESAEYRRIYHR